VRLWDANTGDLIRIFNGHDGDVRSVAFSSDGTRAISGDSNNKLILWDVATGALLRTFGGQGGKVMAIAFSPMARISYRQAIMEWRKCGMWQLAGTLPSST
jgi:WD40 repeat protein